jgi:hypothetical protein
VQSEENVITDDDRDPNSLDEIPKPKDASPDQSAPVSSSRRGLRIRTPAQQRPYQHHAQIFDGIISESQKPTKNVTRSPRVKGKALVDSSTKVIDVAQSAEESHDDKEGLDTSVIHVEPSDDDPLSDDQIVIEAPRRGKRAYYKGKGRAWKKHSEDEDEDYNGSAKYKAGPQPRRQGTTRKKSAQLNQNLSHQGEEKPAVVKQESEQTANSTPKTTKKTGLSKRKYKKPPKLSEEFIVNDTETDGEAASDSIEVLPNPGLADVTIDQDESEVFSTSPATAGTINVENGMHAAGTISTPTKQAQMFVGSSTPDVDATNSTPAKVLSSAKIESLSPSKNVRKRRSEGSVNGKESKDETRRSL